MESGIPYDGSSPLYGLTFGVNIHSVAYQLTPGAGRSAWTETVLYTFCSKGGANCSDGSQAAGTLLPDAEGNLYGVTGAGGKHLDAGTVFELSPGDGGWAHSVLYDFCARKGCKDGEGPSTSLIWDSAGALLGTTGNGGLPCQNGTGLSCGVVFRLAPAGSRWQESVLQAFCRKTDCRDGAFPESTLLRDASGNLFGTTTVGGGNDVGGNEGGGTLFELSGSSLKTLYRFCAKQNCADGEAPAYDLLFDAQGDVLGTTRGGGNQEAGTVFAFKP